MIKTLSGLFILIVCAAIVLGQVPIAAPSPVKAPSTSLENDEPIKINTLLVNIPVVVSDRDGRQVAGLGAGNFTILEDGRKQSIAFFADEKAPMNVVVLIDASGSTLSFIGDIQNAAREFVNIFRPEDKGMVAVFSNKTNILCPFTSVRGELLKAIDQAGSASAKAAAGSDMQDAIYQLVKKEFSVVNGRKAIVVLTDGMVKGHVSNEKLLSVLSESGVLVYPILYKDNISENLYEKFLGTPQKDYRQFINLLASATGGRLYENESSDFKKIFSDIADELKTQVVN